MKGNVASRVTWDQEGRYVTQKWESRVLRSTSLGGNESLSVWPDQGWGMGAPLWAPEFLLWTLRLFPGLVCCLLFCKQRSRASSSLPSLLRWRLFIPGDKPEDPRGGGLKDLEGPVSLAGASAPSQAGHGEEVGRLGTAEGGRGEGLPSTAPCKRPIHAHSSHPFLRSSKVMGPRI